MITNEQMAATIVRYLKFVDEEKSIISMVLKGQLLIESEIERLIISVYSDPSVFDLNRMMYPQKVDLLIAIGVFTKDEMTPYKEFNKIRRKFAHDLMYELTEEDVNKVFHSLSEKHSALWAGLKLDDNKTPIELLKKLLLVMITLITLQNSIDEELDKKPIDPMSVSEIKQYIQLALYKDN